MLQIQERPSDSNNNEFNQNYISRESNNNLSNYNNDIHLETPPSQTGSIVSNSNPNNKNNNTTSSSFNLAYAKKKRIKRKSLSSNNSAKNSNNNMNLNVNQENINKEPELEPIMEAPPLEKIIKREDIYEFYINDPERNTSELMFKNNTISTTKYNAFTFLPKALLYQFIRLANIYFVFIAIIQSIPIISPLGAATAIAPLVFVLAVSLIREAIEDLKNKKIKYNLIYKASQDGDKSTNFHSKVDNKNSLLTIIKTNKGLKFGFYIGDSFKKRGDKVKDNKCFIFSLDLKKIYNTKEGACCLNDYTTDFINLYNQPIYICENCLTSNNSFTCSKKNADASFSGFEKDYELNNNEQYFTVSEIESFQVTFI